MDPRKKAIDALIQKAKELRCEIISMIHEAKSGHPGGALSVADIMTVLYWHELRVRPEEPNWPNRDRVILSKGHTCPVIYAALAMKGFYDMSVLATLRKMGSILQGHPDMKKVPGLDMTSGSLGQGLSVGVGMALGAKANKTDSRIYVILGDGEIQEGQIWEAAMSAAKYKLDNLVAIVDVNNLQVDGYCSDVMPVEPIDKKWESFGWMTLKIDGHSIEQILDAFARAKRVVGKPVCIIASTVKGKGVDYMENVCEWHGMAPGDEECERALCQIKGG
jgi:transketolase